MKEDGPEQHEGCLGLRRTSRHAFDVPKHPKGLRHPIRTQINGQPVVLLTVGHLARALARTPWTVRHWQCLGLLPLPPFAIREEDFQRRRWLYPESFVEALAEVIERNGVGPRLERREWGAFQQQVAAAYRATVEPLLTDGVSA